MDICNVYEKTEKIYAVDLNLDDVKEETSEEVIFLYEVIIPIKKI